MNDQPAAMEVEEVKEIEFGDNEEEECQIEVDSEICQAADKNSDGLSEGSIVQNNEEHPLSETSSQGSEENDPANYKWEDEVLEWNPTWCKDYESKPGLNEETAEGLTRPIDFFFLFFDEEVLNLIIIQTNKYAEEFFRDKPEEKLKYPSKYWTLLDISKLKAYLGILIHMGIVKFPEMTLHWKKSFLYNCSVCRSIMLRYEFLLILRFFHLSDNQAQNTNDKLRKVRPLLVLLEERFKKYYTLHREIVIDEKMIPYTGRLAFKQYIKGKPINWGIKVFVLADSHNGYTWNFKIYTGSDSQKKTALASKVVTELVAGLENKWHHLYFDSYYCSMPLLVELSIKGFGTAGTLRKNRKFLPTEIKKPSTKLKANEWIIKREGILLCLIFKDKREVRLATTIHAPLFYDIKPLAVCEYTKYMGGVDLGNQNSAYYQNEHKSVKWWKRIFMSLLETSINNSYILYNEKYPNAMTPLRFRELLVEQLFEEHLFNECRREEESTHQRVIPKMHYEGSRAARNCTICSTTKDRKTTRNYCIQCDKNVHKGDCFKILHTKLSIKKRNKTRNF